MKLPVSDHTDLSKLKSPEVTPLCCGDRDVTAEGSLAGEQLRDVCLLPLREKASLTEKTSNFVLTNTVCIPRGEKGNMRLSLV